MRFLGSGGRFALAAGLRNSKLARRRAKGIEAREAVDYSADACASDDVDDAVFFRVRFKRREVGSESEAEELAIGIAN